MNDKFMVVTIKLNCKIVKIYVMQSLSPDVF